MQHGVSAAFSLAILALAAHPLQAQEKAAGPGEPVFVNYDFVPGNKVLFFDDFTNDMVGDFARRLKFVRGNMEVAELNGRRFVRSSDQGKFEIGLKEALPERFTIEFEAMTESRSYAMVLWLGTSSQMVRVTCAAHNGQVQSYSSGASAGAAVANTDDRRVYTCRVMVDGSYVKLYVDGTRVANIPNAPFTRTNTITVDMYGASHAATYITNIRIAAGGRDILYDRLAADGRVATQGILFDTGSDRIRPESRPTLTYLSSMLQSHPELKLRIEGHTDNVGADAENLALSEKRAASVKKFLVDILGCDAAQLESKGLGETKPAASNDTPEGRQTNRRVELVKL